MSLEEGSELARETEGPAGGRREAKWLAVYPRGGGNVGKSVRS